MTRSTPSATHIYGLCDPEGEGFTFYKTQKSRDEAAKATIEGYLSENEWSDEVVNVFAIEVTHRATAVSVKELVGELDEDGCDETGEYWGSTEFDYKCDYELKPLANELAGNPPPLPAASQEALAEAREESQSAAWSDIDLDQVLPAVEALARSVALTAEDITPGPYSEQELQAQLTTAHEALRRLAQWDNEKNSLNTEILLGVLDWIEEGMAGPLPPMPPHTAGCVAAVEPTSSAPALPPAASQEALAEAREEAPTAEDITPGPYSEQELRDRWNAQADEFSAWDSLDSWEQLAWAQTQAIAAARAALADPAGEGE